ncbi:hypothetical protein NDU88_007146 [Pleurodeles waltl]|uniref:Uncharacterized protein n=1 Tax=Pleurodeles waltl TaxID=8319 RepID=A0AAV7UNJ4_PLEWA|nr:hypothetical protein NDU88_007146 [Pleurodeles waltl]
MMAASRAAETPGAPQGRNRKTRPSGIRVSGFLLLKRGRGVPGNRKTTRPNKDERTTPREERRRTWEL